MDDRRSGRLTKRPDPFSQLSLATTIPSKIVDSATMKIGTEAYYLKASERTIYPLAGAKQIPAFKVGESWRFSRTDIDGWIREQSMNSQSEAGVSQS